MKRLKQAVALVCRRIFPPNCLYVQEEEDGTVAKFSTGSARSHTTPPTANETLASVANFACAGRLEQEAEGTHFRPVNITQYRRLSPHSLHPPPPPPPPKKIDIDTTGSGARLRTSLTDHVLISDIKLTRGCSLKKVVVHPKFRKIPNNLKNSEISEKIQKNPKNPKKFEKSPKIRNKQKTRNISKKYDKSEKYEKIRKNTKNPKK